MSENEKKIVELKKKLLSLRTQLSSGEDVKTHLISKTRKEVARLKTAINQN